MKMTNFNDLELLDFYCETCMSFISPKVFNEIKNRGLLKYVNYLPKSTEEAKSVVRGRLREHSKYFGDFQTDAICQDVNRLEFLRKELNSSNMADFHVIDPILDEMKTLTQSVKNYFKNK